MSAYQISAIMELNKRKISLLFETLWNATVPDMYLTTLSVSFKGILIIEINCMDTVNPITFISGYAVWWVLLKPGETAFSWESLKITHSELPVWRAM